MIEQSFEDLSQTLRVFLEAYLKFGELINIDRPEAIGNMEVGFNAVIDAFHNLYDAIGKEYKNHPIDWYATPELCMILLIRNARHHNLANKIRSIYKYHMQVNTNPMMKKEYLFVDFPSPPEERGDCFDFFLSWLDIDNLLSLPLSKSRIRIGAKEIIREYMNADTFEDFAAKNGIAKDSIFINVVPLVVNAGIKIHPYIKDKIVPVSVEGDHFHWHFGNVCSALTKEHELAIRSFFLPN